MTSTVIVVGERQFKVSVIQRTPRSMALSVVTDAAPRMTFEVAGRRPWACGVARGGLYVWTARQLIHFAGAPPAAVTLDVDEDLLFVFRMDFGWVLVCEASVRAVSDGGFETRVEFDQVIELARWERGLLVIHDTSGTVRRLAVSAGAVEGVDAH